MSSLRQYITEQQYQEITGEAGSITEAQINQAESWIDRYVAVFYTGLLQKAVNEEYVYDNVTCTTTTCTLPVTFNQGYFKYCILEALDGTNSGKLVNISSNSGNALNFDSVSGFSDTTAIRIYQLGKFPMLRDQHALNSKYYKTIPQEVREATAWQIKYIIDNPNLFTTGNLKSETISDSYSYTKGDNGDNLNMSQYIAPRALSLLKDYSLQTI